VEALVGAGVQCGGFAEIEPGVVALAIRGAIDAVPGRLAADPDLDLERCAQQLTTLFQRAVTAP
jgi:hypothetical protein